MATAKPQIIIIYNADSTIRGKINYVYRKISSSSEENPACAACDLTHGGLSLKEVPGWVKTKQEIESKGYEVIQWHRDEIKPDVKDWVKENTVRYPVVLSREKPDASKDLRVVADSSELASCAGDATKLVEILKSKDLLQDSSSTSSL